MTLEEARERGTPSDEAYAFIEAEGAKDDRNWLPDFGDEHAVLTEYIRQERERTRALIAAAKEEGAREHRERIRAAFANSPYSKWTGATIAEMLAPQEAPA